MNIFTNPTLQAFVPPFQFWVFLVLGFRTCFLCSITLHCHKSLLHYAQAKKFGCCDYVKGEHSSPWPPFCCIFLMISFSSLLFLLFFICSIYSPLFLGTIVVSMTFWSLELQNNSITSMVRFFLRVFCACLLIVPFSKIC
jgi:hypothetical protein